MLRHGGQPRLAWGEGVRVLSHGSQVALVNLANGGFVKLQSEAKRLVDLYLEAGPGALAARIPSEECARLLRLVERLRTQGYLDHRIPRRQAVQGFVLGRDDYLRRPKSAYYSASDRCNLSCPFCYVSPKRCNTRYLGDTERSNRIIDALAGLNVKHLVFSGGEPLLRRDISDLVGHARARGMIPSLTTNGILLDAPLARELVAAGLEHAQISIESASQEEHDALRGPGSYRKSVAAVHNLAAAGFGPQRIYIAATTTRGSLKTIEGFWDFARRLGATPSFSFYQPVGKAQQTKRRHEASEAEQLRFMHNRIAHTKRQYETDNEVCGASGPCVFGAKVVNSCSMGFTTIAVKEDGAIVPCHLFLSEPGFGIGNVLDHGIADRMVAFLNELPTVDSIDGCRDCQVRYFCGNGCWAGTYWRYGTFRHKNPYCGFYRRFWSAVIWNLGSEDEGTKILDDLQPGIEPAPEYRSH